MYYAIDEHIHFRFHIEYISTKIIEFIDLKMKRFIDLVLSFLGLLILLPLLLPLMFCIFLSDGHSPFYIANRVGIKGKSFKMIKIRSMIIDADKSGVESTSTSDKRITKLGHFIRKYKVDELSQLINVFQAK